MRQRSGTEDDAGGGEESIKCLLCMGSVSRVELLDHIAGCDLNYSPHRCDACGFKCFSVERAVKHAMETRHPVTLNKSPHNKYVEVVITQAYNDSMNTHNAARRGREGDVQVRRVRYEPRQVPSISVPPIPAAVDRQDQDELVQWSPVRPSPETTLPAAVERYKREVTPRDPDSEQKKRRKVLSEPKRPMSAWMLYLQECKERLTEEARDAGLNFLEHASAVWYATEDKSKWEQLAAAERERYIRERDEKQEAVTSADDDGKAQ